MSDSGEPTADVSGPFSHSDGLEINEVADGLVVYQTRPEQVHYLNRTAALVFELCTGDNSPDRIARFLADAFGLAEPPLAEVASCLTQLQSLGLIVQRSI